MAIYEYLCDRDGLVEASHPIGTAPASVTCPVCGREARRVYSAPMISCLPPALVGAIDRAEKTRDEPDVVTSLPPKPARQRTPVLPWTPTLRRLPRP